MEPSIRSELLASIRANRLTVLAGAGLSVSPPTALPLASALAETIADQYQVDVDPSLPAHLRTDLAALAAYVYEHNNLRRLLIGRFVAWDRFQRRPNPGHFALADLLMCGALKASATTNFDTHVEDAAALLGEKDFVASLNGMGPGMTGVRHRPFLKPHGCCRIDRDNTVWVAEQLDEEPIRGRLEAARTWLRATLLESDLLLVGFWTDWDYLNELLNFVIQFDRQPQERLVVVVDPAESECLAQKAPELWQWANGSGELRFAHVRSSGAEFLDELRSEVSLQFLRRVWAVGAEVLERLREGPASGNDQALAHATSDELYELRRDVTGVGAGAAVKNTEPDSCNFVGAFHLRLLELGATIAGPVFRLDESTFRVVNGTNRFVSDVRASMSEDADGHFPVDYAVCVGALSDAAASNVVRGEPQPTLLRPQPARQYLTTDDAWKKLGTGAS